MSDSIYPTDDNTVTSMTLVTNRGKDKDKDKNRNQDKDADIAVWLQLPAEILMSCFQYLPRQYIPDYMWLSSYFVSRWRQIHVYQVRKICKEIMPGYCHIKLNTLEDGVLIRQLSYITKPLRVSTLETSVVINTDNSEDDSDDSDDSVDSVETGSEAKIPITILFNDASYRNGKLHGSSTYYRNNGKIRSVSEYRAGVIHGLCTELSNNGELCKTTSYEDGVRHGVSIDHHYVHNGRVLSIHKYYKNDKLVWVRAMDGTTEVNITTPASTMVAAKSDWLSSTTLTASSSIITAAVSATVVGLILTRLLQ